MINLHACILLTDDSVNTYLSEFKINIETYLSRTQINNMYIQNEKINNDWILTGTIQMNSVQNILIRGDDNDAEI